VVEVMGTMGFDWDHRDDGGDGGYWDDGDYDGDFGGWVEFCF